MRGTGGERGTYTTPSIACWPDVRLVLISGEARAKLRVMYLTYGYIEIYFTGVYMVKF